MHIMHDAAHVSLYLRIRHHQECKEAVGERGPGAECNQRIHIRRPVQKAFKSADEKFLIDYHDDHGKEHLYQSHGNMIAIKKGRKRPAPHDMSHGKVQQYDEKDD